MKAVSAHATVLGERSNRITNPLRIACVVLPAALFLGLAWVDYRDELARTRNDVATATNALAEHARTVVESVDLVIARVMEHIAHQDWTTLASSPETHDFLDRLRRELPQVEAVFLVDPTGSIAASSRAYPMPRYDVHGAEYFAAAKARNDDALVISAPFPGTISGTTGFMISRRRVQDGKFDGVVGVTVSRQYFDSVYRAVLDVPDASAAGLVRTDGAILVRFPDLPSHQVALPASNAMMTAVRSGTEFGLLTGSIVPGRQRAYRRLQTTAQSAAPGELRHQPIGLAEDVGRSCRGDRYLRDPAQRPADRDRAPRATEYRDRA